MHSLIGAFFYSVLLLQDASTAIELDDKEHALALMNPYHAKVVALREENLAIELARMQQLDQLVRTNFLEIANDKKMPAAMRSIVLEQANQTLNSTDALNTARLKTILQTFSWKQIAAVRPDAAGNAFLIVQHSGDLEFMENALPNFEQFAQKGVVNGGAYALLFDRVAMMNDRPQRYGSQARCVGGELVSYEIENREQLDKRRADFGMQPFDVYIKGLKNTYINSC